MLNNYLQQFVHKNLYYIITSEELQNLSIVTSNNVCTLTTNKYTSTFEVMDDYNSFIVVCCTKTYKHNNVKPEMYYFGVDLQDFTIIDEY